MHVCKVLSDDVTSTKTYLLYVCVCVYVVCNVLNLERKCTNEAHLDDMLELRELHGFCCID